MFPEALNPSRISKTVSRSVPDCTNMKTHTIGALNLDIFDYPPVVLRVDCQEEVRIGICRGEIDRPPSEPEKVLVCPKCKKSGIAKASLDSIHTGSQIGRPLRGCDSAISVRNIPPGCPIAAMSRIPCAQYLR